MARGNNFSIPSNTGTLAKTLFAERQTVLVLNPNNGIVYVKINSQADPLTWDWVVPSQSRAFLPGPWLEYGLYYVDQSGAGATGNVTVYETDQRFDVPDYAAIGVARLAQQSSMDVVEGTKPANPGAGILRLWADTADFVHALNPVGADATLIDTLTALGGDLIGSTLPNPVVAPGAISETKVRFNWTDLISQVVQPANAPAGFWRLWIDQNDSARLKRLDNAGNLYRFIDQWETRFQTWNPLVYQSTGMTLTSAFGQYAQVDKWVLYFANVTFGGGGSAGSPILPAGFPLVPDANAPYGGTYCPMGAYVYLRSGIGFYTGALSWTSTTNRQAQCWQNAQGNTLGATPSFAIASGDAMGWAGIYKAA